MGSINVSNSQQQRSKCTKHTLGYQWIFNGARNTTPGPDHALILMYISIIS